MSCYKWYLQGMLYLINILLMAAGILLIGHSIQMMMDPSELSKVAHVLDMPAGDLAELCPYIMGVGVFLLLGGIMGTIAVYCNSKTCLSVYSTIMWLSVIADIACIILIRTGHIKIQYIETAVEHLCEKYDSGHSLVNLNPFLPFWEMDKLKTITEVIHSTDWEHLCTGVVELFKSHFCEEVVGKIVYTYLFYVAAVVILFQYYAASFASSLKDKIDSQRIYQQLANRLNSYKNVEDPYQ